MVEGRGELKRRRRESCELRCVPSTEYGVRSTYGVSTESVKLGASY